MINYHGFTRLVVIYMSPIPRLQLVHDDPRITESIEEEKELLEKFPRESVGTIGDSDDMSGVFVRSLGEKAFEKHMKNLETY
jgi:hypothetical protein